ncbi:MAG TPA: hypothetical protein VF516_42605, partial [Kofleriaceae bacterium]
MSTTRLALCLLLAGLVAGCATNSNGDDGSNGGDGGMTGDDAPPFTNGVSTLTGAAMAGYVDGAR